ncbi:MAG: TonB-dependent receptor, partial [Pseudomonadota bacterium]
MELTTKCRRKSNRLRLLLPGLASAWLTATVDVAIAQVEEVIVTARKLEENLQSTPVTVSAFTEQGLRNRGITNNAEIGLFTPNVVFDTTSSFAGTDTFQAFIRGVGQSDFALNTDPGVGVYVDGVYYSRAPGAVINLLDIERVEVLKGPQGTLFGRNSIGGAVNIITREPSDESLAFGEITYGRFDRVEARGAVSGGIIEGVLAGSVAFSADTRDGYQTRLNFGADTALGGPSDASPTAIPLDQLLVTADSAGRDPGAKAGGTVRTKLRWTPNDEFAFTLTADATVRRDAANPTTLLEVDPEFSLGGLYNTCVNIPADVLVDLGPAGPPCLSPFLPTSANADGSRPDLLFNEQFIPDDIDTSFATGANFANLTQYGIAGTAQWAINDQLTLKSITAYRQLRSDFGLDIDSSPVVFDQTTFTIDTDQISQELQLNWQTGRFDATAGVFYLDEDGSQVDNVPIAGGLIQVAGGFEHDTRSWAIFGEGNYDITPTFSLIFGVRYSEDEKELILNQQNLNTEFSTLGLDPSLLPRPDQPQFLGPPDPLTQRF